MLKKLENKVCIVTGATSGMGKAIAESYSDAGAQLILSGRNIQRGTALANALTNAIFIAGDVSEPAYNTALVNAALDNFGKLDTLSLNAGMLGLGEVIELSEVLWHKTLNVNLSAIYYLCKAAIPHLQKEKGSNILINASIAAYKKFPEPPGVLRFESGGGCPYETNGRRICARNSRKCHMPRTSKHTTSTRVCNSL